MNELLSSLLGGLVDGWLSRPMAGCVLYVGMDELVWGAG